MNAFDRLKHRFAKGNSISSTNPDNTSLQNHIEDIYVILGEGWLVDGMYRNNEVVFEDFQTRRFGDPTGYVDANGTDYSEDLMEPYLLKARQNPQLTTRYDIITDLNSILNSSGIKILSLYTLSMRVGKDPIVDKRIIKMGDAAIHIMEVETFLNDLEKAFNEYNIKCQHQLVNYIDPVNDEFQLSYFNEHYSYKFQKEYRILAFNQKPGLISLDIPRLKDYCILTDIDKVLTMKFNSISK